MRRFLRSAAVVARRHPYTSAALIGSSILLATLFPAAWLLYRNVDRNLMFNIVATGASNNLADVSIHIIRRRDAQDLLSITMGLDNSQPATGFFVEVPDSLQLHDRSFLERAWHVRIRPEGSTRTTTVYLKPRPNVRANRCVLEFEGRVLPQAANFDLRLLVHTAHNGAGTNTPTEVIMSGLYGVTFDQIIPEPVQRSSGFVRFASSSWTDETGDGSVALRAVDSAVAARNQFLLFLVATAIGVLLSVVTSAVQSLLAQLDDANTVV